MRKIVTGVAIAAIAAIAIADSAVAQRGRAKAGTLTCNIAPGVGLIIMSSKSISCSFQPVRGRPESYVGSVRKFGLDVGATAGGRMVWAVYAPSSLDRGALAGNYAGASAEATVGAGLGANVLVGGSNRTVSLQPLSVQGQAGLNLAAGVADLQLQAAR
jgi:hypothetical protein